MNTKHEEKLIMRERIVTIDEAYVLAGGHGKYQRLVAICNYIPLISSMLFVFSLPFFGAFPEVYGDGGKRYQDADEVCQGKPYKYADPHFNFVTEFDLICREFDASLLSSGFLIGFLIGNVIYILIGDNFGRLTLMLWGQIGIIGTLLFLVIFSTYNVCLCCCIICGIFSVASFSPTYAFANDSNHSTHVAFYATYLGVGYAVGEILVSGVLFTNIRWRTMCYIIMLFSASYFVFPYILREAPRYYYAKGNIKEAMRSLEYIAAVNDAVIDKDIVLGDEGKTSAKAASFREKVALLCEKWELIKLGLCSLIFFACGFVYFGIALNLHKFKGNLFLNALITALTEIIGDVAALLIVKKAGTRNTLIAFFAIAGFSLVSQDLATKSVLISSISLYIGKLGISGCFTLAFMLAGELFSAGVTATAMGFCILLARLGAALGPIVGNYQTLLFIMAISVSFSSIFFSWALMSIK